MSVFAKGSTALITGSASGVGLAVASLCRKYGMNLALVDNNKSALAKAKEQLSDSSSTVESYNMDVSKIEQWEDLRDQVKQKFGSVELLMLNAGIGLKSGWEDNAYFQKIMDVNLFGQINGLNTFLPLVQSNTKPSSIVMTGSKQGITNPPGNPAYNASKAAVKALAEHLSYDLRSTNISVHLLVPGWTYTGLTKGSATEKPAGAWAPEQVASFLEEKMKDGKFWVLCPDNDVTEDMDRRRMLYTAGDAVYGRPPLSRWREETKEEAAKTIENTKL